MNVVASQLIQNKTVAEQIDPLQSAGQPRTVSSTTFTVTAPGQATQVQLTFKRVGQSKLPPIIGGIWIEQTEEANDSAQ